MQIRVLSRSKEDYVRTRPNEITKLHKNPSPLLHPFEREREYKRALNSAKLGKIFAKPFIGALSGHLDGVYCMARHRDSLTKLLSGACDGEVKLWNLTSRSCLNTWKAHTSFVRGVTFSWDGNHVISCGSDKLIQMWEMPTDDFLFGGKDAEKSKPIEPVKTWVGQQAYYAIDHQRQSNYFATAAINVLQLWDPSRTQPIQEFTWGEDSLMTVKFNPVETYLVATCSEDRAIVFYDLRGNTAVQKVYLSMKSSCISWNPMQAYNFTVGNEDHNCYSFDLRNLRKASTVHEDHVGAVLSLDYSPTGQEFVTGSYDKTLRIFPVNSPTSREIYFTKRMQKIFSVCYSGDAAYVLSASDDTNIRLWKAQADANLQIQNNRQKQAQMYKSKLLERYKHLPEIHRIHAQRIIPKHIKLTKYTKKIMKASQKRKLKNRRRHSKPGSIKQVPKRQEKIVAVVS